MFFRGCFLVLKRCSVGVLCLLAYPLLSFSASMDAPHNFQGCLTCHDMSAFDQSYMIPVDPDGDGPLPPFEPSNIDDTFFNNICKGCHNGIDAPKAHNHSSLSTSNKYGDWSVGCSVCHNQHEQEQSGSSLGINGRFIRNKIDLSKITGLSKAGIKAVELLAETGDNSFADGDTLLNGICEVCHTQTAHFRNDGTAIDQNHGGRNGSDCMLCHGHGSGFLGGADHSGFIADDSQTGAPATLCSNCHAGYAANPETAHSACTACHATVPALAASTFPNATSQPDWDGAGSVTMTDNLVSNGYSVAGRLLDAEGDDINGSPGPFTAIKCGFCHVAKPDALAASNHGGHSDSHFSWDSNCGGCHFTGTEAVVAVVHGDNCTLCHSTASGGPGTAKAGSATNGVDGDATIAAGLGDYTTATCTTCHPALIYDPPVVHHDSSEWDTNGSCTNCHSTVDHSTTVSLNSNCADCHTGTEGTATSVPLSGASDKQHDACTTCHFIDSNKLVKLTGSAAGNNGGSVGGTDAVNNCETCHNGFVDNHQSTINHTTMVTSYVNCAVCHAGTQGIATTVPTSAVNNKLHDSCSACHGADGRLIGSASGNNGGTNGGSDATNSCFTCHGEYFVSHTNIDHSLTVALNSNCVDCHTGTQGTATTVPLSAATDKQHDSCLACHNTAGVLQGSAASNGGGADCETCHNGFASNHQSTINHSTTVNSYVNCTLCHSGTEGTSTTVPLSAANNKVHDACTVCHAADGRLVGSASGNNGGTNGGSDAANSCFTCHGEYFVSHVSVDHSTSVGMYGNCSACHSGTAGTATTVPVSAANDKVHDSCGACHNATGALTGSASGNTDPNSCFDCHGEYFASHTHHTTANNQLSYDAALDRSQESNDPSTACALCHIPTGGLATWTGIYNEHNADCSTCHDYVTNGNQTGDPNTPLLATVNTRITTDATTICIQCHVPKLWSTGASSTHGGHDDTSFGWDGGCISCHADGGNGPVSDLHGDACTLCHATAAGGYGTAVAGPAANGVDGNSSLAATGDASYKSATCTTCHPALTYDPPVVHHDSSEWDTNGSCTNCHNTVDHSTTVSLNSNCADCHTGTEGTATTVPLSGASDKQHDACTTCHFIDTDKLVKLTGSAAGNNGGSVGGTDAVNNCETCHNGFVDNHQSTINHATMVTSYVNCAVCHAGTQGIATTVPTSAVNNKLHDSCSACHGTDGRLIGSASGNNGGTNGGSDATNSCFTCHGEYFVSHSNIDHSLTVALNSNCADCHTGTQGTATTVPVSAASDKQHDTCLACHTNAGVLQGNAAGNGGGADCETCHNGFASNHQSTINHSTTVNSYVNCTLCHSGTEGTSTTVPLSAANNKVHDACTVCHAADGRLVGSASGNNGGTNGGSDAANSCFTCHGEYFVSHANVDHATSVGMYGNCSSCHSGTEGTATTVPLSAANDKLHDSCSVCHNATGALTGSASGNTDPNSCFDCHGEYFVSHTHHTTANNQLSYNAGVDRSQESNDPSTACAQCHTDNSDGTGAPLDSFTDILGEHLNDCNTCHDYANDLSVGDNTPLLATVNARIATDATTICTQCHVPKLWTNAASDHGTVDHTALGYVTFMGTVPGCDTCHIPGTIDATIGVHLTCQSCHTASIPALRTDVATMKYVTSLPAGGGDCETCHHSHAVGEESGVDTAQHPAQTCGECHGGLDRKFTDYAEIKMHHYNNCGTCHDSTRDINDPNDGVTTWTTTGYTVADVIANGGLVGLSGQGIPDDTSSPTNCTNCHRGRMGLDHTGHPMVKAGIKGSKYSDDAVGQQTLNCFTNGCHAANTAEEHLTPRGVAYKNYQYKYNSAFDCEFCHQYKFPVNRIKGLNGCSDPAFSDQTSCENGTPTWSTIVGLCSDPAYTDQTSCENATPVWNAPLIFNDDPVIQAAIVKGIQGVEPVYCSDCHKEDVNRHDFGECSNPVYQDQTNCEANSATWTVSGYCDNSVYTNQTDCESNSGTWKQSVPYSMHDKYNGAGIYDISERHHAAEEYTGTCSNAGITDETACWDDGSVWTASYSPGVTYVDKGDCTACHIDPREVNGLPAPKKLPCIECHIDNDVAGDQVTVYKSRAATQDTLSSSGYTGWSWSFTGNIANTDPGGQTGTQHQWDVNGGDLQNYGACVFCHKMRPYHAMTDPATSGLSWTTSGDSTDADCSDGTCDIEHFPGVGRNGMNVFFGAFRRPIKNYVVEYGSGAKPSDNTVKADLANIPVIEGIPKVNPLYWQRVTYDPLTDPHGQVPGDHTLGVPEYFVIPVFDTPSGSGGDSVTIIAGGSGYNQGTPSLTVQATCSGTCTEMIMIWAGNEYSMGTGPGTYSRTVTSANGVPDTYPSGLPGFDNTPDTALGRVYVISVDSNDVTTDQAAIDFKKNNVKSIINY